MYYNKSMNTSLVQTRMRPELKQEAEYLLKQIGLSPSEAIRAFYTQITLQRGIPFDMRVPNQATLEAFEEFEDKTKKKKLKRYSSTKDMMTDILSDPDA